MKKFLSPKILIPVLVSIISLGVILYILLAPETWWKPIYVRMELDETPTPELQVEATAPTQAQQNVIPTGPQTISHIQTGQPSGIMYKLEPKVVNLAEPGGLRYLQVAVVLELWPLIENYSHLEGEERTLAVDQFTEVIDTRRPVIYDILTTLLSSKTYNDIATIEGKQALKTELMSAINNALGYQGVINIYFTEFVVQ
jgi:flagellar basal body-associated protein FliL